VKYLLGLLFDGTHFENYCPKVITGLEAWLK
jgi:hypothetical protein